MQTKKVQGGMRFVRGRRAVVIKLCEFKERCMLLLRWIYIGIQERRPKERIRCGFRDHMII